MWLYSAQKSSTCDQNNKDKNDKDQNNKDQKDKDQKDKDQKDKEEDDGLRRPWWMWWSLAGSPPTALSYHSWRTRVSTRSANKNHIKKYEQEEMISAS